jgi:hypothetical protein
MTVELSAHTFKVAVAYEDDLTRQWADEVCRGILQLLSGESVFKSTWRIGELTRPETLPEAVRAAVRADMIVVSLFARAELPVDLCVWFDAWLPRRPSSPGMLVSLVGVAETPDEGTSALQDYLWTIAQKAGLVCLSRRCPQPPGWSRPDTEQKGYRAGPGPQVLAGLPGLDPRECDGWGINE